MSLLGMPEQFLRQRLRGTLSGLIAEEEPSAVPTAAMHSALQQALSAALVSMVEGRCRWVEEGQERLLRAEAAGRMALQDPHDRVGALAGLLATFRAAEAAEREALPFLRLGEAAAEAAEWRRGGHFDYLEESAAVVDQAKRRLVAVNAAKERGTAPEAEVVDVRERLCRLLEEQLRRLHSDEGAAGTAARAVELRKAVEARVAGARRQALIAAHPRLAAALRGEAGAAAASDGLPSALQALQQLVAGAADTARRCVRQAESDPDGEATPAATAPAAELPSLTICCAAAHEETQRLTAVEQQARRCTQWRAELTELLRLERVRADLLSGALEEQFRCADDAVLAADLELQKACRRTSPPPRKGSPPSRRGTPPPEQGVPGSEAAEAALAAAKQRQRQLLLQVVADLGLIPEVQELLPMGLSGELQERWEPDFAAGAGAPLCTVRQGGGPAELGGLLTEAELLLRLRHPNVEEVTRLVVHEGQLRYHKPVVGQRLRRWFEEAEPSKGRVCGVVRDLLRAVAHLEMHGVVHGRVRPSVLRVTEEEGQDRAVLCDLRLERGARTDCDGDGERGWENGLPEAGRTDVQALGRSLLAALSDQGVGDDMEECFNELARGRLTAGDALQLEVLRRRAKKEKRVECVICFQQTAASASVVCSNGHLHCKADFEALLLDTPAESRRRCGGRLRCQGQGCDAEPFGLGAVARALSPEMLARYEEEISTVQRKEGKEEGRRVAEQTARARQREAETDAAVRHIQDEVLNLKCPKCGQVVFDWDACAALRCPRCNCGFCGLCLLDCGDAHSHVPGCRLNQNRGSVYAGGEAGYAGAHRVLKQERLTAFLRELRPVVADELRRRMGGELAKDGLRI